jgi:dolichol-phosphate mannosyltransferase
VPITFTERRHGTSKMDTRIIVEAMCRVTAWGLTGTRRTRERVAVASHA